MDIILQLFKKSQIRDGELWYGYEILMLLCN